MVGSVHTQENGTVQSRNMCSLGRNIDTRCPHIIMYVYCTWVWVRPIFTMSLKSLLFLSRASCSIDKPGSKQLWISSTAAMCIAVGKVSLELWLRLTWSLGWTGCLLPNCPPRISIARLLITWDENRCGHDVNSKPRLTHSQRSAQLLQRLHGSLVWLKTL